MTDKARKREYLEYVRSGEAKAIAFARRHLDKAKDRWVDMIEFREFDGYQELKPGGKKVSIGPGEMKDGPCYAFVKCALYPKNSEPAYPSRRKFSCEEEWMDACRYITWETADSDISMLKSRGYVAPIYIIHGRMIPVPAESFFIEGTPPEILALLDNPNDRTDPLWDEARRYMTDTGYEYRITGIKRAKW